MTYRDENHALRAHLAAAEERLRDAERALAEATQRAAAHDRETSALPRAGMPAAGAGERHVALRSVATAWACVGIVFIGWQLFEQRVHPNVAGIVATMLQALVLFAAPSAIVLRRTASPRAPSSRPSRPRVRVVQRDDRDTAREHVRIGRLGRVRHEPDAVARACEDEGDADDDALEVSGGRARARRRGAG